MWDKTKAYKNNRTVKRGYDLMFENFFFYFLFLVSKLLSSFNPLESFFLLFHVSDSKSLYMEIQVESGGAGAPSRPPLAPPLPWAMGSCISTKPVVYKMISFSCSMQLGVREIILRMVKSDMTREPNTVNSFINRS